MEAEKETADVNGEPKNMKRMRAKARKQKIGEFT